MTHARLGLVPTWGLSVRLPRKIGLSNAKIMSFTGRKFNGDDAQKIGLVDMLFDDDKLMNETFKLAEEMAVNSFDSIRKQKKMMDYGFMSSQREALAWTDEVNGFHPGFAKDMKERMNTLFGAGKNKRKVICKQGRRGKKKLDKRDEPTKNIFWGCTAMDYF